MAKQKYAAVAASLPRTFGLEPSVQQQVDVLKAEHAGDPAFPRTAIGLTQRYMELRTRKDELEAELAEHNIALKATEQLLIDQYTDEGLTLLRLSNGKAVSTAPEPHATVKDREAYRLWCLEQGYEKSMCLPWQTTNSLAKERLIAGEPEAPGIELFVKTNVKLLTK